MELIMIECCECKITFFTKNETGEHECPKCSSKNERYKFDEYTTEEEIKLAIEIHKDIINVFKAHGVDNVSNIKILDLIMRK